jgi:hypothetical protein
MDDDQDLVIELMRRSISAAVQDGGADRLATSLVELAEMLIRLGEYDLAWNETERAARQLPLAVDADLAIRIEIIRADIDGRRGNALRALARLRTLLDRHAAATPRGARVRAALARSIGYDPRTQPAALAMLADVVALMRSGELPAQGLSEVPERRSLERLFAAITAGGTPAIVALLQVPGADEEALLRGQIVLAEFTGFTAAIPMLFGQLCRLKATSGRWLRVLDLAQGLFLSARRTDDGERQLEAINLFNVGKVLHGDAASAIEELEATLATAPAGTLREAIAHNLSAIRAATGQLRADAFHVPEVRTPMAPRDASAWSAARALLDRNDLEAAVTLLRSAASGV